jgi:hypothetical protein
MSISVISGWSVTAATGVVAVKSKPQESQNFAVSLFWVPHREQYNPVSEGIAET